MLFRFAENFQCQWDGGDDADQGEHRTCRLTLLFVKSLGEEQRDADAEHAASHGNEHEFGKCESCRFHGITRVFRARLPGAPSCCENRQVRLTDSPLAALLLKLRENGVRRAVSVLPHLMTVRPRSPNQAVSADSSAKLAEAEKALVSIRQARDAALERLQGVMGELSAAKDRISELEDEAADAAREREAADRSVEASRNEREDLRRKCEELRQRVRELNEQRLGVVELDARVRTELTEARDQIAALLQERDRLREELSTGQATTVEDMGARVQLLEAQAKISELSEEMDRQRAGYEKKLSRATTEVASANRTRDLAVANVVKAQAQVQSQKAELKAARDLAKEEKLVLEAQIVALQVEAGITPSPKTEKAGELPAYANGASAGEDILAAEVEEEQPAPAIKPFQAIEIAGAIAALQKALDRAASTPEKPSLLEKLEDGWKSFNDRARISNLPVLHRTGIAALEVARWLRKTPAKAEVAIPALKELQILLNEWTECEDVSQIGDLAGATIFAVDDDIDNCECISMALEKLEFQTKYSVASKQALAQLENTPVDLIVLDVDLPQMDGFELYRCLRETAPHAETPVIFLSALISTQSRLDELPPGNHAFLSKPYNLTILGAKATAMILGKRLGSAPHR